MPTPRKRIGFLPRIEVQKIIDEICKQNKLSQSKVTGILVEEALTSRGVLNISINNLSKKNSSNTSRELVIRDLGLDSETHTKFNIHKANEEYIKDEVKMINEFIEYKVFKNIMSKNKRN